MVDVNTFGTGGPCEDDCLSAAVRKAYDLTPAGIIKPVSYTHLDVYKRQTQQWIMENYPDSYAAQTYIAAAEELLNGTDAQSGENGYYTYIYNPVSYTHLDVYKRQAWSSA